MDHGASLTRTKHPEVQQIAFVEAESGEFEGKRLTHQDKAEQFYRALAASKRKVRVEIEAARQAAGSFDAGVLAHIHTVSNWQ